LHSNLQEVWAVPADYDDNTKGFLDILSPKYVRTTLFNLACESRYNTVAIDFEEPILRLLRE
jgi:hypothetical protein